MCHHAVCALLLERHPHVEDLPLQVYFHVQIIRSRVPDARLYPIALPDRYRRESLQNRKFSITDQIIVDLCPGRRKPSRYLQLLRIYGAILHQRTHSPARLRGMRESRHLCDASELLQAG